MYVAKNLLVSAEGFLWFLFVIFGKWNFLYKLFFVRDAKALKHVSKIPLK
jgi:hypothetical protein